MYHAAAAAVCVLPLRLLSRRGRREYHRPPTRRDGPTPPLGTAPRGRRAEDGAPLPPFLIGCSAALVLLAACVLLGIGTNMPQ